MPVWRLQTAIQGDSVFPRDAMVITPHFNDAGALTDPQTLCNDLATAISGYLLTPNSKQVTVRAYDAQGTVPVEPQGEAIRNVGLAPASSVPRELAVCLSFYSTFNRPRMRGRLYIPVPIITTAGNLDTRPPSTVRTKVGALAAIFANLGGTDVDWCVYSRADNIARSVSNWWVDDEWDVVRSRGLRPTLRLEGTLSE